MSKMSWKLHLWRLKVNESKVDSWRLRRYKKRAAMCTKFFHTQGLSLTIYRVLYLVLPYFLHKRLFLELENLTFQVMWQQLYRCIKAPPYAKKIQSNLKMQRIFTTPVARTFIYLVKNIREEWTPRLGTKGWCHYSL